MANEPRVCGRPLVSQAARDDQRVERAGESFKGLLTLQCQARATGDWVAARTGHTHAVGVGEVPGLIHHGQARGHAGDVQQLGRVVADDHDQAFVHAATLCQRDRHPKVSDVS